MYAVVIIEKDGSHDVFSYDTEGDALKSLAIALDEVGWGLHLSAFLVTCVTEDGRIREF